MEVPIYVLYLFSVAGAFIPFLYVEVRYWKKQDEKPSVEVVMFRALILALFYPFIFIWVLVYWFTRKVLGYDGGSN